MSYTSIKNDQSNLQANDTTETDSLNLPDQNDMDMSDLSLSPGLPRSNVMYTENITSANETSKSKNNENPKPKKQISVPKQITKERAQVQAHTQVQVETIETVETKEQTDDESEFDNYEAIETEKFSELTYTEVQINLRILGDLKESEKIMITDEKKYMQVDKRICQMVRRYWTSDSRKRTLRFIAHVIESAKKYCNDAVEKINKKEQIQTNLQLLINIQQLLGNALTGLGRLATTYGDDKLNLATIETFKSTINVFCDHDLKRAISGGIVSE
jgi:hypothetical protein